MMKKVKSNKKTSRGSVTVFITMILVPCVFFTGFIVDIARLKLFTNQAVMAADTYGAAALSEYDGYLYTMYGLFAMSQDGDLDSKLTQTQDEIKKTFKDGDSKGMFMPYSNIESMTLTLQPLEQSSMSNTNVLETQIADYMKYRVVKNFVEADGGGFVETMSNMEHLEENLDAAEALEDLKNACSDYSKAAENYYKAFDYINKQDGGTSKFENDINELNNRIIEYNDVASQLSAAYAEDTSDYDEDEMDARDIRINGLTDHVAKSIESVKEQRDAIKSQYLGMTNDCNTYGGVLAEKTEILNAKAEKVKELLNVEGVDKDFKEAAQKEVDAVSAISREQITTLNGIVSSYNDSLRARLDGMNPNIGELPQISEVHEDYTSSIYGNATYQELEKYSDNSRSEVKDAKQKTKNYKDQANEKIKELYSGDEASKARDIPAQYATYAGTDFDKVDSKIPFKTIMRLFSGKSGVANTLIDDYLLVEYDMGMFSNRTTQSDAETLVGYKFSPNSNYSYLAEIEYLIGGKTGAGSAQNNLDYVRNRIIAFRMMMNYLSTYKCSSINTTINEVTAATAWAPPVAFALNQAIRIGIATFESAEDWSALKKGEKVILFKTELKDFSESVLANFGVTNSGNDTSKKKIEMDYAQYCEVMLFFFTDATQRVERTSNLIEINVNCCAQNIGSSGTLSNTDKFSMTKAYTAVDSTFSCRLPFAVMPRGFAQQVSPENAGAIEQFQRHNYTYTMTRGY